MPNEELPQRGYLASGVLRGDTFGSFELLNLGATNLAALVRAGVAVVLPTAHAFVPTEYRAPLRPSSLKPDSVYLQRRDGNPIPVAVGEHKPAGEFSGNQGPKKLLKALEQGLTSALALQAPVAFATDGTRTVYIDVAARACLMVHSQNRTMAARMRPAR